jgi:ATP-dependent helicase HrpB
VVVSAPTGSGKSTRVPTWCPRPVLVVEPRRVACRSLAQRVAELEGVRLGGEVGYWVRDEKKAADATAITFATPGIALRVFGKLDRWATVILDEFHERTLDVDLLLALLMERRAGPPPHPHLVVMSATLEGERVAAHLGGRHLAGEGRVFPVEVRHLPGDTLLPDVHGLETRVRRAVRETRDAPGDVLVFLPGKAEIASSAAALAGEAGLEVMELHGGLTLEEQARAFQPSPRRKVVLATNVAETSVTLPGVGVVIDSGLVRRTRYVSGRGFLTLVPVARDSAEQRAGRAGRTGPGQALRLWSEAAQLESRTPPEVHREALAPLLLAAAACGARVEALPFLDPPKEHAVAAARDDLRALGALDGEGRLTERGGKLFGLPLDAALGALLAQAEAAEEESPGLLRDVVDLVSVLAVGRRIFLPGGGGDDDLPADPQLAACDATAILRAVRSPPGRERVPGRHFEGWTLGEARKLRQRLESAYGLGPSPGPADPIDRRRLALSLIAADPRRAHVARRRGRRLAWSHGGTEIELARESGVARLEDAEALVVLDTMALGLGGRDTRILATAALPVPPAWLLAAGLGRDRLGRAKVDRRGGHPRLVARVERVFARRVLEVREEVPRGELARRALAELFVAGRVFPEILEASRDRLEAARLALALAGQGRWAHLGCWEEEVRALHPGGVPELEVWIASRLGALGFESGEDLGLLSPEDLLAPDVPPLLRRELDRRFPRRLELPGAVYRLEYAPRRREVTLDQIEGERKEPPLAWLPDFEGFRVRLRHQDFLKTLREG